MSNNAGKTILIVEDDTPSREVVRLATSAQNHTLLEAGQLANELLTLAESAGMTAGLLFDFDDWKVDAALEADGVEEGGDGACKRLTVLFTARHVIVGSGYY